MAIMKFVINILDGTQDCFLPTSLTPFYTKRAEKQNNNIFFPCSWSPGWKNYYKFNILLWNVANTVLCRLSSGCSGCFLLVRQPVELPVLSPASRLWRQLWQSSHGFSGQVQLQAWPHSGRPFWIPRLNTYSVLKNLIPYI